MTRAHGGLLMRVTVWRQMPWADCRWFLLWNKSMLFWGVVTEGFPWEWKISKYPIFLLPTLYALGRYIWTIDISPNLLWRLTKTHRWHLLVASMTMPIIFRWLKRKGWWLSQNTGHWQNWKSNPCVLIQSPVCCSFHLVTGWQQLCCLIPKEQCSHSIYRACFWSWFSAVENGLPWSCPYFFHNALYKLANDSTHTSNSERKLLLAEWAFKPKPIAKSPGLIDSKRGASGPRVNVLVASDGEKQQRLQTGDKGERLFMAQKKIAAISRMV